MYNYKPTEIHDMDQTSFLKLFEELTPFKKHLASTVDYQRLRFTYDDIMGFLDEKMLYVFNRYSHKPYEEVKALTISSLYALRVRLYRKYGREVSLEYEDSIADIPHHDEPDYHAQLTHLLENLGKVLTPQQLKIAKLIFMPPAYVLHRVKAEDKRIPSHLYLEYLGASTGKQEVKKLNRFRKGLVLFIRDNFSAETLDLLNN